MTLNIEDLTHGKSFVLGGKKAEYYPVWVIVRSWDRNKKITVTQDRVAVEYLEEDEGDLEGNSVEILFQSKNSSTFILKFSFDFERNQTIISGSSVKFPDPHKNKIIWMSNNKFFDELPWNLDRLIWEISASEQNPD